MAGELPQINDWWFTRSFGVIMIGGFLVAFWQRLSKDKVVEKQISDSKADVARIDNQISDSRAEVARIDGSLTSLIEAHREHVSVLKEMNQNLRDTLEYTKKEAAEREAKLREQLGEMRAINTKLSDDFRRMEEQYDKARIEIHGLRGELQKYKLEAEHVVFLRSENDRLRSDVHRLSLQVSEMQSLLSVTGGPAMQPPTRQPLIPPCPPEQQASQATAQV